MSTRPSVTFISTWVGTTELESSRMTNYQRYGTATAYSDSHRSVSNLGTSASD